MTVAMIYDTLADQKHDPDLSGMRAEDIGSHVLSGWRQRLRANEFVSQDMLGRLWVPESQKNRLSAYLEAKEESERR